MRLTLISDTYEDVIGPVTYPVLIGRGAGTDVSFSDKWTSRRHCEIDQVGSQFILRDLNSRHGTFVNGRATVETVLSCGDRISVGMNVLTVKLQAARAVDLDMATSRSA